MIPPDPTPSVASTPTAAAQPDGAYARLGLTPTPPPTTRLRSTQSWDEASRPRRPQSAPDVTYSDRGRAIGQHLIDVYGYLRAELMQLRDLIDQVRQGAVPAAQARSAVNEMTMRQNDWKLGEYCAAYCRVVTMHHGIEDESIFTYLRSREPALGPVLDRLGEEHETIHGILEQVDRALVGFVGNPDSLAGLQDSVDTLTDTLLSHLSYEEHEIVEPLARLGFFPGQV